MDQNVPKTVKLKILKLRNLGSINDEGKATHLHAMDSQARTSVQLLVANMAFKMLCLLMLNEDLFIIKVSITVPLSEALRIVFEAGNISRTPKNTPCNTQVHQGR